MVKIIRQIVPQSIASKVTYGGKNPAKYITVHQTGNTSVGANAKAHANLQSKGNSRSASWHYSVDDKEAYQSFEDTAQCWAASDGKGAGNTQSIHVEICINADGDYVKAVQNGAELVAQLSKKHGISIMAVKQHNDWYPKNCPAQIRAGLHGITWSKFIDMVKAGGNAKVSDAPKTEVKSESTSRKPASNVLRKGDKGAKVTALQKDLISIGEKLPKYGADGDFGMETEDAVKSVQRKANIAVDGVVGPDTRKAIESRKKAKPKSSVKTSVSLPNAVYRANKPYPSGSGVKSVQEALSSVHFYPDKGAKNNGIDGVYGPKTADAVRRFQSMHGLVADGVYGPKTREKLLQVMK